MQTDIAIIGGGLAGLALAARLEAKGADYQLFEARSRVGGRILTQNAEAAPFDMGPSWFWPGQPRMAALVEELGLTFFDQHADGASVFENERGEISQSMGFASMRGSWRLAGGTASLPEALQKTLPQERVHISKSVIAVQKPGLVRFADGSHCEAQTIALTMPPRVMAELTFDPPLPVEAMKAMKAIPTWMAGHAKFYASYEHAFWKERGLSGDAFSRRGPMAEIHDASPADPAAPAALFGFVGVPASARAGQDQAVMDACVQQLARLFGPDAAKPIAVQYKDWAADPATATAADLQPPSHHPSYTMPRSLSNLWDGKLVVCGTETAPDCGGFMEGALAAAHHTASVVLEGR